MNELDTAALVVVRLGLYLDSKVAFMDTTRQGEKLHESNKLKRSNQHKTHNER